MTHRLTANKRTSSECEKYGSESSCRGERDMGPVAGVHRRLKIAGNESAMLAKI